MYNPLSKKERLKKLATIQLNEVAKKFAPKIPDLSEIKKAITDGFVLEEYRLGWHNEFEWRALELIKYGRDISSGIQDNVVAWDNFFKQRLQARKLRINRQKKVTYYRPWLATDHHFKNVYIFSSNNPLECFQATIPGAEDIFHSWLSPTGHAVSYDL